MTACLSCEEPRRSVGDEGRVGTPGQAFQKAPGTYFRFLSRMIHELLVEQCCERAEQPRETTLFPFRPTIARSEAARFRTAWLKGHFFMEFTFAASVCDVGRMLRSGTQYLRLVAERGAPWRQGAVEEFWYT